MIPGQVRSVKTVAGDLAYRQTHRAEAIDKSKRYRLAHPEKVKETQRRYRAANRAKITATKKKWRQNNRDLQRAAGKRWKINRILKICDFDALVTKQEGRCAICGLDHAARVGSGRLSIDHCHESGKVRGLLCHRCNSLLGHAKDNIDTLKKAITYLEAAA